VGAEIVLRAERRLGELSAALKTSEARAAPGVKGVRTADANGWRTAPAIETKTQALAAIGITPRRAAEFEKVAEIPEDAFEAMLAGQTWSAARTRFSRPRSFTCESSAYPHRRLACAYGRTYTHGMSDRFLRLGVRMSEAELAAVEVEARRLGVTVAELVRSRLPAPLDVDVGLQRGDSALGGITRDA
jgi:hypothetical protein